MRLLAIDTATESCSAALWVDGTMHHRMTVQARLHAEYILPFINELLQQAQINKSDIQGLIVGQGPGAFTGVRIGVGVAQGLALALGIPVLPVSNLQTLAYSAYRQLKSNDAKTIVVATDARMNEVYWARYGVENGRITMIEKERVGVAKDVDLRGCDAYIGSGFSVYSVLQNYAKKKPMSFETNVYSQAQDMILMVKDNFEKLATSIDVIEPVYLREP